MTYGAEKVLQLLRRPLLRVIEAGVARLMQLGLHHGLELVLGGVFQTDAEVALCHNVS